VILARVVSRVDVVDASWANELNLQDRFLIPTGQLGFVTRD
jgi:hypothetical protein